ncbi:MAG: FKBP-type peptidyl-prolyl cis-trans isomerase [Coriobacteriales bacterium]|jgi:hypothetical protein|nr:FKBP-type peptidyl-prolyl cis-trans isomerase [Coriobacteriales bacterium]
MKSLRTIIAFALSLMLAFSFFGCKTSGQLDTRVAAKVNGVDILEADVTTRIEFFRIDQSTGAPMSDEAWAKMLKEAGFTPETLREFVIRNHFAIYTLIVQRANEAGLTIDSAQVDKTLADTKSGVESSGTSWEDYLKSMGYASEAAYRHELEAFSVAQTLANAEVEKAIPTQAEIEAYVSENASAYAGKRVSAIYLPFDAPVAGDENAEGEGDGEESTENEGEEEESGDNGEENATSADAVRPKAEEALAKLREGVDFAEVAREYSEAYDAENNGGDLGWGSETTLSDDARAILNSLAKDEFSDVIETNLGNEASPQYAFLILKWTDDFPVPEDQAGKTVDFSTVPTEIAEALSEDLANQKKNAAQEDFFAGLVNSDEIIINPMPEGLPYVVDMTLAEANDAADLAKIGITDTVVGTGVAAKQGDALKVHYTGYLEDGTIFDSSIGRGTPYDVTLGQSSVIRGWELGLVGMKVGGKRQLVIPPELAYGTTGQNSIPPNATLTFEIELLSVNGDSTGYTGDALQDNADGSSDTDADADDANGADSTNTPAGSN